MLLRMVTSVWIKNKHAYPWFWNSKIMLFLKFIIAGLYFPLPIQIVVLWKTNLFASVTWAFLSISGHWISTGIDLSLQGLFATDWGHFCFHNWERKLLLVCSRWKSGSCWISHDALRYPPPTCNQFSSVAQPCPTLYDSMDCSTSSFPVHHQLPGLAQTHVHRVSDAIQPSHPLSSPSLPTFNLCQSQGLFQKVSSMHQVVKVLEFQLQHQSFQWIFWIDFL